MTRPTPSGTANVSVGGSVSGQILVGDYNMQIGEIHGSIVNINVPGKEPTFAPQRRPVLVRPHPFRGLLDRETETRTASDAILAGEPVSMYGPDGLGKTSLLRRLAYESPADAFPDGVVYCSARGMNAPDLLQYIFESFFESDVLAKPTDAQLHQLLQNLKALVLLDDVVLESAQISILVNSAPQCIWIFASPERCLWGEGRCVELGGLPAREGLMLIERELGRTITEQEQAAASMFFEKVSGHPLHLIQGAALVRHGRSFAEVAGSLQLSPDAFAKTAVAATNDAQRRLLAASAASGNYPMPIKHLAGISQVQDAEAQLQGLLDLRVAQANSPAYNLTGSLALSIGHMTDLSGWEQRVLGYFVEWIKQNPPLPDIADVLHLLLHLVESADRAGRSQDVITLGRRLEKALILGKRWQSWYQVLQLILKAAQALADRATQGWALHELGTRSLCLADIGPARQSLTQALDIRRALGDRAGAAATQHNLGLIIGPPPSPPRSTPPKAGPAGGSLGKLLLTLIGVGAVAGASALWWLWSNVPTITPETPRPDVTTVPPPTTPPPVPTQVCAPGVVYCENFEDQIAQDFSLGPGWSIAQAESKVLDGTRAGSAILTNHGWADYRVSFKLRVLQGTVQVVYRLAPDEVGNRYAVSFEPSGLSLTRHQGGQLQPLKTVNASFAASPHFVEIAGWGSHLAVFVNNQLQLNYVDDAFLKEGTLAFETFQDSHVQIDDIEVRQASSEIPTPDTQGPDAPSIVAPKDHVTLGCPAKTAKSIFLQWSQVSDPSGVSGYTILLQASADDAAYTDIKKIEVSGGSATQFDLSSTINEVFGQCAQDGLRFFRWQISARDGAGNAGSASGPASFRVFNDATPPAPPTIIAPKDLVTLNCPARTGQQILLSWQPPSDPSGIAGFGISVQSSSNNEFYQDFKSFQVDEGQATSSDISSLINDAFGQCQKGGLTYFRWQIFARDGAGNTGSASAPATFRVFNDVTPPPPPIITGPKDFTTLGCPAQSGQPILLSWQPPSDPSGIAGYEISLQISSNNEFYQNFRTFQINDGKAASWDISSAIDDAFKQCTYYGMTYFRWQIRARDGAGNWSNFSKPAVFVVRNQIIVN